VFADLSCTDDVVRAIFDDPSADSARRPSAEPSK
jgi:hypothetical protein